MILANAYLGYDCLILPESNLVLCAPAPILQLPWKKVTVTVPVVGN